MAGKTVASCEAGNRSTAFNDVSFLPWPVIGSVSPDFRTIDPERYSIMTHVVTQPCFGCKYTDCVVVCPVECFYEGEKMLYIHPEECIDCEACVPECPVEAIFHEDNVPDEWADYVQKNADECENCEVINEKKEPLADQ